MSKFQPNIGDGKQAFLTIIATIFMISIIILAGQFGGAGLIKENGLWETDQNANFSEEWIDGAGDARGGSVIYYDPFGTPEADYTNSVLTEDISGLLDGYSVLLTQDPPSQDTWVWQYYTIPDMGSFTIAEMNYYFDFPRDTTAEPLAHYDAIVYLWANDDVRGTAIEQVFYQGSVNNDFGGVLTWTLALNIQARNFAENYDNFGLAARVNLVGTYGSGDITTIALNLTGSQDLLYPSVSTWNVIIGGYGVGFIVMAALMTDPIDLPIGGNKKRGR